MSEFIKPTGWAAATIADISYRGEQRRPNESSKFTYIDIGSINRDLKIIESPQQLLGKEAPSRARKVVNSGDILVSLTRPNLNAVALVPEQYDNQIASTGFEVIKTLLVDHRFIFALVRSKNFIDSISGVVQGALYPAAKSADVQTYKFYLPPLAEQKIIADKLDTLLAQVETTKARLERIPEILKSFRQSVLAAAVSGKLTEGWRLINGLGKKQFAEAIELTEFRGRKLAALPLSWQWLRFNQVAEIASNLVSPVDNPDAIHIAPNHIDSWTGSVSNFQTIFDDGVTSAKHRFTKGQIIYSKIRPYLAKVAIAEFDGLCSADMYPINSRVNTKFLFRWMLTSEFTDWASNAESRSVLPKINQKDLNKIPVPTPPIKEQAEIVKRIEDLFTFAESIEQKANAALDRVNNLIQTILAKAFRGALTADWRAANYELITGENSVEALLEKIKAEREAIKPKKNAAPRKKA